MNSAQRVVKFSSKEGLKKFRSVIKKGKLVKVLILDGNDDVLVHIPIYVLFLFSLFTPLLMIAWLILCVVKGFTIEVYSEN